MLNTLSPQEYTYWRAFFRIDGYPMENLRSEFAKLKCLIINSSGRLKQGYYMEPKDYYNDPFDAKGQEVEIEVQLRRALAFRAELKAKTGQ